MRYEDLNWQDKAGNKLHACSWKSKADPLAVIGIVHGQGEHSARYKHVAEHFVNQGYAVMAIDHFGHGKSPGKRGHIDAYESYMDGVGLLIRHFGISYTEVPAFLYGHSMGGNFVINYTLRRKPDLKGVIASAPWLRLAFQPPTFKTKLARVMTNIYPAYSESNGLDAAVLSHDPKVVQDYIDDPMVHDKITARAFLENLDAGEWALANASQLTVPMLLMHGSEDKVTSFEASREFASKAKGNASFKGWDGMFHEIHNEPKKQEVLEFASDWIKAHLGD